MMTMQKFWPKKILLAVFIMQLTKIFFFEIMHDIAKFHKLFGFWN